jgi:hypothetical protein
VSDEELIARVRDALDYELRCAIEHVHLDAPEVGPHLRNALEALDTLARRLEEALQLLAWFSTAGCDETCDQTDCSVEYSSFELPKILAARSLLHPEPQEGEAK